MKTTKLHRYYLSAGFSLVEAVIAAAIIATGIAGIAAAVSAYDRGAATALPSVQATLLAEEGIEAVYLMRDTSWSGTIATYAAGTPYALAWQTNSWATATTLSYIDNTYWRTITFQDVQRNSSEQIVSSGGTNDPNTRLITSSVSWSSRSGTSTVTLSAYVSNLFNN